MEQFQLTQEEQLSKFEKFLDQIKNWFIQNKSLLIKVFVSALIFGLIAHAYGFLNLSLSHDVLVEYRIYYKHKISIGRFLQPVLRILFGFMIVTPWLEGIISIFLIACSSFVLIKTLKINSTTFIVIITAIFISNTTITCIIATYEHDLLADVLALLFSCLLFSSYKKNKYNFRWVNCIPLLIYTILICGLYQAYFLVSITLILIDTIVSLLQGKIFKRELKNLIISFLVLLLGVIIYFCLAYLIALIVNVEMGSDYNSLGSVIQSPKEYIKGIIDAYLLFIYYFFTFDNNPQSVTLVGCICVFLMNVFILTIGIIFFIKLIKKNKTSKINITVSIIFVCFLPLIANFIAIFSYPHELTLFANLLMYVLVMVIFEEGKDCYNNKNREIFKSIICVALTVIVFNNCVVSNTCYVKKDLEEQATLSMMTRIVDRVEETSGYVYGETKVAILGLSSGLYCTNAFNDILNSKNYVSKLVGMWDNNPITYYDTWSAYFNYVMHYEINLVSEEDVEKYKELQQVKEMGTFPSADAVKVIDGVIVVKVGEIN